jgi:nitrogenase molybdenum-iron protein beta chain
MSFITEFPRGTCVLGGVNNVLSAVTRVCPIYHSGPGCCMQTSAGESGQSGLRSPYYLSSVSSPCSNMLEREVVFGGAQKLRDEIDGALEIIEADAYFVLTGCTAGIIGDDILAITDDYRKKGLPVYPVTTPGFKGDSLLGYEAVFEVFTEYIVDAPPSHEADLVNLFGIIPYHDPHWSGTLEELSRILSKLGLRVNTFFTGNQNIETVKKSGAAALNIIVSPYLLKNTAKIYEEKFGVRCLRFDGVPIGPTQTSEFVRQVAEALQLDNTKTERVLDEENRYVYNYFETIIGAFTWKRFAVAADAGTAIGVTRFLADDFSMNPVAVVVTEQIWSDSDRERITERLTNLEYARPPVVRFLRDHYDIRQELKKYEYHILLGSSLEDEVARELDVQLQRVAYPISDILVINRTYAGFRGCLTFIEDLFDNL